MMGMSRPIFQFQLGRYPVLVDITAPLLWLLVGSNMSSWFVPAGTSALDPTALGAMLVAGVLITVSVLVHELGHAIIGEKVGAHVDHIALTGMGGYCASTDRGLTPGRRLLMVLAGPGFGLIFGMLWLGLRIGLGAVPPAFAGALSVLIFVNIFWSLFNLLPMAPLDGGSALRYLLATRLPMAKAVRISSIIGVICAALVAMWALSSGQTFIFVMSIYSGFLSIQPLRR
jgi:Zn-dependent protease